MLEIEKLKEQYKGSNKLELSIPELGEGKFYCNPLTVKDAQKILNLFDDKKQFEGLVECIMKLQREDGSSVFLPQHKSTLINETPMPFIKKYGNMIAEFYLTDIGEADLKKNS